MRNVELLERTMQHILDHPQLHEQSSYFYQAECGTAACFAGWACMLSDVYPASMEYFSLGSTRSSVKRGDYLMTAFEAAQNLLGLTHEEARTLFDGANTREMLQLMVKDLVNGDELRYIQHYERESWKEQ